MYSFLLFLIAVTEHPCGLDVHESIRRFAHGSVVSQTDNTDRLLYILLPLQAIF
jgi:hypothetical protein